MLLVLTSVSLDSFARVSPLVGASKNNLLLSTAGQLSSKLKQPVVHCRSPFLIVSLESIPGRSPVVGGLLLFARCIVLPATSVHRFVVPVRNGADYVKRCSRLDPLPSNNPFPDKNDKV